jgi:hypothetical protein
MLERIYSQLSVNIVGNYPYTINTKRNFQNTETSNLEKQTSLETTEAEIKSNQ